MDKYTVDLDKVLNDFEYSEYSLESAKSNKNIQEEIPNASSFNSNYSKNDTTIKHSINNVFHSLNEYLSSDITPKTPESVLKSPEISSITSTSTSIAGNSSIFPPQITGIQKEIVTENLKESHKYHFNLQANETDFLKYPPSILQKEDYLYAFKDNLVEKTDSFSGTDVSNQNSEVKSHNLTEDSTVKLVNIENITHEIDVGHNPVKEELGSNQTEKECDQNGLNKDEISEEILVDLGNNSGFCMRNDEQLNAALNLESTETAFEESIDSKSLLVSNEEMCLPHSEDSICKLKEFEVPNKDSRVMEVREEEPKMMKIGFHDNIDLDEENLDQYFEELEQEFSSQIEEEEDSGLASEEKNTGENNATSLNMEKEISLEKTEKYGKLESRIVEEERLSIQNLETKDQSDLQDEEKVSQLSMEDKELSQDNESKIEEKILSESILIEKNDGTETNSFTQKDDNTTTLSTINIQSDSSSEGTTKINESPFKETNVDETAKEIVEDQSDTNKQESEKNCRPQQLTLSDETKDAARKINLIGDPGSTPYNNVYSTKDFEKNIVKEEGSGDQTSFRPSSPTYSDVSTDSVSSTTSDDAEYNDAVSEINIEKKVKCSDETEVKTQDKNNRTEETIQNNMVSSGEICRSDVTADKDFKNNLKLNNLEESHDENRSKELLKESVVPNRDIIEGASGVSGGNDDSDEPVAFVDAEEGASAEQTRVEETITSSLGIDWLGKQAPLWIPDNEATSCLHCDMKFTVIKRRHHCRACGLVLCSKCCNLKYRLEYLDAEARVCKKCYDILNKDTNSSSGSEISQESSSPSRNLSTTLVGSNLGQPNPNNPLEYCSTVSPLQQVDLGAVATPSVMVPVGVLKRKGSNKGRSNKSVMFCDGIRPGSDLTNLDTDLNYMDNQKAERSKKSLEKSGKSGKNLEMLDSETRSFIPSEEKSLPPTVTIFKTDIKYSPCANNTSVVEMLRNEPLIFALQSNVFVHVKIINMDCCLNRMAWCFSTEGLINVGQDEIVILLELIENEPLVPKEIFIHINNIYLEAVKGSSVKELGLSLHTSSPFLGSKNHAGFVYIRPTFQCLQNVIIPKEPYLIGILIHRWETPWAKLFPLRLVLRLGAEYKYYPSPIISTRERDSVFVEIGHTIINLLADFRNFSYSLPQIRGLTIHMEDKNTTVTIPVNRYDQVMKGLCNSSDHILAFAGNFSTTADSHLVCIQDTQSATSNYSTHAINICNQPRKVTGASFIVFNGALKSTSGLTAKSNIVEDGLMIQILPEHMLQVRESLRNMKDHTIRCGCVNEESDETVTILWGEPDSSFNVGVLSPIDNKVMTGIPSIRVHNGKDYTCNSGSRLIRWTEVFIIQSGEESTRNQDPVDISKISENIAKATCQALVKYLDLLVSNSFYKIGLRANLHVENVSYLAGSNNVKLPPIYMKSLDNELIPVLHRITSNNITEQPIILELIFRILNI